MQTKRNYELLDIFKFIFCIMIIAIHTNLLYDFSEDTNWYITHLVLRLAVPFFFIVSGFLYGTKILQKNANISLITKKYFKRLLIPLIFWLIMGFIPEVIKRDCNVIQTIKELYKNILFYPYGALWYIYSLLIAIPILSLFYKKGKYLLPIIIGFFLYIFALLGNSYYFVSCKIPIVQKTVDTYVEHFLCTRNGIFVGILFVSLGVYLAKIKDKKISMKKLIPSTIFFYILLIIEVIIVKGRNVLDDHSLFISLPFFTVLFVLILIKLSRNKEHKILRNMSTGMYFMHRVILEYLLLCCTLSSNKKVFICVLLISMFITYILLKINNKHINKLIT